MNILDYCGKKSLKKRKKKREKKEAPSCFVFVLLTEELMYHAKRHDYY